MNLRTPSLLTIVGLIVTFSMSEVSSAQSKDGSGGIWAAAGLRLDQSPSNVARDFASPNRLLSVRERDGSLSIVSKSKVTPIEEVLATPSLTEVLWSPDSTAVVINASDGGLVGTWDPFLYVLGANDQAVARDIRQLIEPQAQGIARCATNEVVNLGAVTWLDSGNELLIALEVPPHTSCRNPGVIVAYRISVRDWKVLERIPEERLRTIWGKALGSRFGN